MKSVLILAQIIFVSGLAQAEEFMSHDKVLDGFIHVQKAPQMGRVIYEPVSKVFPGKRGKKHNKKHEQKFGRKNVGPVVTPTPAPSASPNPTVIPPSAAGIDLRGRDGPVEDQIGPYCTAYAMVGAIQNVLNTKEDLSQRHLFSLYGVYSVEAAYKKVPGNPITTNQFWPRTYSYGLTGYKDHAKRKLTQIKWIGDGDIEGAKIALASNHPVYFGHEVPSDMSTCLASIRPTTKMTNGGHATLIVGYKKDDSNPALGGGYFIVKNSWSTACGDKGYQYWPFSVCKKSYCYFYEVIAAE